MLTVAAVFIGSGETPCPLTMRPRKENCFLLNSLVTVAPANQSFVMLCGVCHHVPAEGPAAKTVLTSPYMELGGLLLQQHFQQL